MTKFLYTLPKVTNREIELIKLAIVELQDKQIRNGNDEVNQELHNLFVKLGNYEGRV